MANIKNTTINDNQSLKLPNGSTGQRPSVENTGMIRFNSDKGLIEQYDGVAWFDNFDTSALATGGTVNDITIGGVNYRIHSFATVGTSTFTVTRGGRVEYLIVAGGGSGQDRHGGAGGAGGLLQGTTTVTPGSYTIIVGAGGTHNGQTGNQQDIGEDGDDSSAFGLTAIGGGRAGHWTMAQGVPGFPGGSGGAAPRFRDGVSQPGGEGVIGQGNNGARPTGPTERYTPGGGGAGEPGHTNSQISPGKGGDGIGSTITGTLAFYAGGGGGGAYVPPANTLARGGAGGGGCYIDSSFSSNDVDGDPNTGGGGGAAYYPGGGSDNRGGSGGSGVVIIRYKI